MFYFRSTPAQGAVRVPLWVAPPGGAGVWHEVCSPRQVSQPLKHTSYLGFIFSLLV